mmetsp:Transcript_6938/g.28458  ORF Transcript_6938/g.28458 Transcript_6938/m.28458 type:complete len:317 (+) Transcript_6938:3912-4862(+)
MTSAGSISCVIVGGAPSRSAKTDAADARGRLNAYARKREGSNSNVRVASTVPGAGAANSKTCPEAHPANTASPASVHASAETGPGATTNPTGASPVPFSRSHAKNHTLPSSPAVTSIGVEPALCAGAYCAQVTAPLCGLTASMSFQASAQRSKTRATPSPKPTTTTRRSGSTAGGAQDMVVAGALKRAAKSSLFSAYAKTRTLPSSPAVMMWSLIGDASNATIAPAWKSSTRVAFLVTGAPFASSGTRTTPPFSSCTSQWSGSDMIRLLIEAGSRVSASSFSLSRRFAPLVMRNSSSASTYASAESSPGSASLSVL